jgi:hypothetical protein
MKPTLQLNLLTIPVKKFEIGKVVSAVFFYFYFLIELSVPGSYFIIPKPTLG